MRAGFKGLQYLTVLLLSLSFVHCQKTPQAQSGLISEALMSDRPVMDASHEVLLIELESAPLLASAKMNSQGFLEVNEEVSKALQEEQQNFEKKLYSLSSDIKVLYRYKYTLNGMSIIAHPKLLEKIQQMDDVREVQPRRLFSPPQVIQQLAPKKFTEVINKKRTSVTHLEAQAAYDEGIRGQGIRIGVIDSGIDYTHSMLGGVGDAKIYEAIDESRPTEYFPNKKVVGGIDLVGEAFNAASLNPEDWIPHPDENPLDFVGHGTHVAGTIAGIGDGIKTYDGVAPEASLYAIKVFGSGSTSDEVVIAGFEYAVDPNQDGVLNDKLHVINLSLGGNNGTPYDLYNKAVTQLSHSGTVVVASAGNSGDVPFIVGSPSTSTEALSVAASIDSSDHNWRFKTVAFLSEGEKFSVAEAMEAQKSKPIAEAGDVRGELVFMGFAEKDFTEEEARFLKGKVALIDRGMPAGGTPVTFEQKMIRAEKAGAIGVVIAQNKEEAAFIMGSEKEVGIPAIMISLEVAKEVKARMEKSAVEVVFKNPEVIEKPDLINQITDFSSRGPRSVDLLIKPEVTAPGKNIISAAAGKGTESVQMSGTSMSGPHVTGVMALMKQKFPRLSSRDLKSVLMSTALQVLNSKGEIDSVARQGAGHVMINRALKARWVSDPASLSLGLQQIERTKKISRTVRLKSLWDDELQAQVSLETNSAAISLDPVTMTLNPQGMTDLKLNFTLKANAMAGNEQEISGWVVVKTGEHTQKIPFLTRLQKVSNLKLVQLNIGAESKLEMEGADVQLQFANRSVHSGEVWPFNLIGLDSRKETTNDINLSRECDLKAVGYRINGKDLEIGVKLYGRISAWSLCEVSVMLDKNHDKKPEAELAMTVSEHVPGLTGMTPVTTLLDYTKARALRKKAEEDQIKHPETPIELNLKPAILDQTEAQASNMRSAVVMKIPLESLKSVVGLNPKIQVLTTAMEHRNSEPDDYLKDEKSWMRLSLDSADQSWVGLQNLTLQGGETRNQDAVKGAGRQALLMIFPQNSLDSRNLNDEQIEIYRPRFGEKERELSPVNP